jgi:alpha-L-fucosidase
MMINTTFTRSQACVRIKKIGLVAFFTLIANMLFAQEQDIKEKYVAPTDPAVKEKLAKWQTLKFGLFMHWGPYSQWGVVESWSICPEDEDWTKRKGAYPEDYNTYVKEYEKLPFTFNPVKFKPENWVKAAKDAGMKYVVFTTKHHDGFAMYDTRQNDYKITSSKTPFSANPRSNIAKEVFNAFRKDDFMIGAYFSKPDWHSKDFWWPYFPPKDRNVNYDPLKYPERWKRYKDFTFRQIEELMTGYGNIDILWLDGGWMRPKSTIDTSVSWQRGIKYDQDLDMAKIAAMSRSHQPGLLMVDRTVTGPYENYTTPEQTIPNKPLEYPWESCITMGNSWSFVPGDQYKPAQQIIHTLVKIVSRGGSLLLNIGVGPDGEWDAIAYQRLQDIGKWMKINGEGIYSTMPVAPYANGNIYYTRSVDSGNVYAFLLKGEKAAPANSAIELQLENAAKVSSVKLLGSAQKVNWKQMGNKITITGAGAASPYTTTFKIAYK